MTATSDFKQAFQAVRKGWRRMSGPVRRMMLITSGEYIRTSRRPTRGPDNT